MPRIGRRVHKGSGIPRALIIPLLPLLLCSLAASRNSRMPPPVVINPSTILAWESCNGAFCAPTTQRFLRGSSCARLGRACGFPSFLPPPPPTLPRRCEAKAARERRIASAAISLFFFPFLSRNRRWFTFRRIVNASPKVVANDSDNRMTGSFFIVIVEHVLPFEFDKELLTSLPLIGSRLFLADLPPNSSSCVTAQSSGPYHRVINCLSASVRSDLGISTEE